MLTTTRTNNHWNKIAHSYHEVSLISKAHISKFEQVADLVLKFSAAKVLDLGCGSGILEAKLMEKGFGGQIEALDNSEEMLKIARKSLQAVKNVNIRFFDLNSSLPFEENSFDCAVAINVMFSLDSPRRFVEDVFRILKSGGHLVLVNPKPKGGTISYFREHFRGHSLFGVIKEILVNISILPSILRVIISDKKLDRLAEKGVLRFQEFDEIKDVVETTGFEIQFADTLQGNQNWVFVAEKA